MKIRFTKDWLDNKKGSIVSLPPNMAMTIVDYYQVAEIIDQEEKSIKYSPKDKMVKGAEVDK